MGPDAPAPACSRSRAGTASAASRTIEWVGTRNYQQIFEIYPPFWPAFRHNIIWLVFLTLVPTTLGLLLAYLLDKKIRGTRVYQSIFFLPVVLSLAVVGFIWQLVYSPEQGLLNNILGTTEQGNLIDWLGNPDINLWAVLVAAALAPRRLHHDPLPGRAEERRPVAARGGGDRRRERVARVPHGRLPGAASRSTSSSSSSR